MNHTPGPWKLRETYHQGEPAGFVVYAATTDIVTHDEEPLSDESYANGQLIAAAPAMRAALEVIRARLDGVFDHPALEAYGPLGDTLADIRSIVTQALGDDRYDP